jgi:hypothetical protein
LRVFIPSPDFEAPDFLVAVEPASVALDDVSFLAIDGKMADFIAFKTDFLRAGEGIVGVFTAKDACGTLGLVGALSGPVAALVAVFAANQWVLAEEIA